jgi:hypothetical protein
MEKAAAAPPPKKGFIPFVRQHDHLITVVGALIVFLGFFVREVYRDRSKELSSEIRETQMTFATFQNFTTVMNDLDHIADALDHGTPEHPRVMDSAQEILRAKLMAAEDRVVSCRTQLDFASGVVGDFATDVQSVDDEEKSATENVKALDYADGVIKKVGSDIPEIGKAPPADTTAYRKQLQEDSVLLDKIQGDASRVAGVVSSFQEKAVAEVERQRLDAVNRVKRANAVSIFLFAVGWSLGLVGKIAKLPSFDDSGD